MVGCEVRGLPSSYLGLPLGSNPKVVAFLDLIMDKVRKRLASWKKGFFSKAGKLTLIRFVLTGILIYFMSLFSASWKVCKSLKRVMREFLWEGVGEGKGEGSHLERGPGDRES